MRAPYGRVPLRANGARQRVSSTIRVPAPTGGWETQQPLQDMKPDRAVRLDNFIPRGGYVELRKGYLPHRTGIGAPVETLMVWRGPTSEKMFAAASTSIYHVSGFGSATSAAVTGLTNAQWQNVNFGTPGGNFLRIVNGADTSRIYNGTSWTTGPAITASGLTATNLIDVFAHKQRLYFIEKNSCKFWFLAPTAIGGTAESYDLATIFSKGGHLVAGTTWSIDGGAGPDDYAVFASSEGQVAVYQGIDPGNPSDWALVGIFDISRPIGRRCFAKLGGDVAVITEGGLLPLSQATVTERALGDRIAITGNVNNAFQEAALVYRSLAGWQTCIYDRGELLIINIPLTIDGGGSWQFVQNVTTGAWCRWTGIPALCWSVFQGNLYFGGPAAVYQADTGYLDNSSPIIGDGLPAFSAYRATGMCKHFKMVRPIIVTAVDVQLLIEMATDFRDIEPTNSLTLQQPSVARWDVALWDTAVWGEEEITHLEWAGASTIGTYGSPRFRTRSTAVATGQAADATIKIIGFDVLFEPGGVL